MDAAGHRRLLTAFVSAARTGDVAALEALLAPDAVSLTDGNGMRGCARVPVVGRERVARLSAHRPFWRGAEFLLVNVNAGAGVLVSQREL
ncbi:hypothetical protein ACFYZJ_28845 [Streptomyces sp. NPDC001848]|uniref:hypothetical protein n=1 Tax=Streptomyces sp. NPDC001848 TaxID=3364618 RepID=UPI0036B7DB4A